MSWGYSNDDDGARKNPWRKALSENWDAVRDKEGRNALIDQIDNKQGYDPFSGSWGQQTEVKTGYESNKEDVTSAWMKSVGESSGIQLASTDALSSAANANIMDNLADKTNEKSFYKAVDYGPDGRTYAEIALGIAGSVMDAAATGQADPMGNFMSGTYAAGGSGSGSLWGNAGTDNLLGGGGMAAAGPKYMGYDIYRDGIYDKVDMNGETYMMNVDGSLGAKIGLNGLPEYQSNNSMAEAGAWNALYGGGANDSGIGSFYGSGFAQANDQLSGYSMSSFYGSDPSGGGNIWGNTTQTADAGNIWGNTTPAADNSSFWGTPMQTADNSSFWGNAPAAADTSWWGGQQQQQQVASNESKDNFYNSQFWSDDNKYTGNT